MAEVGSNSWQDELASLMDDTGIRYPGDAVGVSTPSFETKKLNYSTGDESVEVESFKDQVKEFGKAWGELLLDLGRGCKDIVMQNLVTEDSYVVQKVSKPLAKVSGRLSFLNDYLPEDRDPVHAWSVVLFVAILALAALSGNTKSDNPVPQTKRVSVHPPSASHILLPDGRHMAYQELGVPAERARFSLIAPHSFLSSRLAGIPGIKVSLLEEFGVRLVTYDLPGFGESDPNPSRNLNSSAWDMLYLADAVGVSDKFWVLGYSSGAMHAWAALRYISNRISGAAMFAPMVNPYDPSMTKEERSRTWENWVKRRRLMYYLARSFPKFLSSFYHRTFLSGKHGQIEKWLSLTLGEKDKIKTEESEFVEFWHRDVEESIRQGRAKPFTEEAVLQVSNWGFSLADLRVQNKCQRKGFLPWLKSMYSQAECELAGFLNPIHIWQGTDDRVVPPSVTDYISRVIPQATVHKLPNEGHYSYFFLCNECHRQILTTLFGSPQGPLDPIVEETDQITFEGESEKVSSSTYH